MALLVPNHHVIVPETRDLAIRTTSIQSQAQDRIYIELFGDSIMCGRDPDALDPVCGVCSNVDMTSARVAQPPGSLIEFFLPQYKLVIITRSSGNSTSGQLLNGTDGVNERWPDNIDANIVVINHGMNDAKNGVPVQQYKNNLIALRQRLGDDKIMVWQTPTVNKYWNTDSYAEAMREVAVQYGDFIADANLLPDWLDKLPDGLYPRQLGYAELVDVCLSSQLNSAILSHLESGYDAHSYYRKDHQEKFVLDYQDEIQLSFTPFVHKWVEVYLRDNLSFTAVSRGLKDTGGILAAGVWSENTGEQITSTTASYNLVKIRREDGRVVFNKNYTTDTNIKEVKRLADDLNGTTNQYIVVITTKGDPSLNRTSPELLEAIYRCGASSEIFESSLFKIRSAYTLVGIPGCGQGNGLEAYGGLIDASDSATSGNANSITIGTFKPFLTYYTAGTTNEAWSELLNTHSVWQGNLSAEYNWQVFFPNPGIHTVSVSVDNTANVYIAANTLTMSSNIGSNLVYSKILETIGSNSARYGTPQADSFVIPRCGWYDIKIVAEDFNDSIQTPLYYTSANTQSIWSTLLNTHGVYNGDMDYQWDFYAPTSGIYTLALSMDTFGDVKIRPIDGTTYTTMILAPVANGASNSTLELTTPYYINRGWYVIKMNVTNTGGPAGIAATIKNVNGDIVWTTRDMRNSYKMNARGVAGIIQDTSGATIWTTRGPRNSKENYEAPGQRVISPFESYSEIEFSISSSGIPFPIDVFPPVAQAYVAASETIEPIRTSPYKFISNVPPVNGTRLLNPKYADHNTNGIPGSTYHITPYNTIKFSKPITGVVTVISDTVDKLSANASVATVQNIHSLTEFVQRFNPARWAFGSNATTVSEDTGIRATRPFDSAAGVNSLGLYNTEIKIRVGDSRYAEPMVLSQPQHGYVRITQDRRHMAYVPFPDYAGVDAFTYTLLSQTGQAGQPKSVYVEVTGNVSVYPPYVPPTANVSTIPTVSVDSFTVNEYSTYAIWVITGDTLANAKPVTLSLSGLATQNTDYVPTLSVSNSGGNTWVTYSTVSLPTIQNGVLLARVPLVRSNTVELGESLILSAEVQNGNMAQGVATINNAIGKHFNNDWRYPETNTPIIIVTSNIVWERSPYAIWVVSGDLTSVNKQVSLRVSGSAIRGQDYVTAVSPTALIEVSENNGISWSPYQYNNRPRLVNGLLLARLALLPDNQIEVGETIILSAGVSAGPTVRGTVVIDDLTGVEFTNTWSYVP